LSALMPTGVRAQAAGPLPGNEAEARAAVVEVLRSLVGDVERPLTGLSVAWLQGDTRVSRAWAGWRSIGADHPVGSLAMDGNTLFRVASMAKVALAVVMLRLHDARLLDLDEDLSGPLRLNLRHPRHPGVPITPRLLLSHRSGLLDAVALPLADAEAFRRAVAAPAHWGSEAPGRHFRYSNFGMVVLATAMEAAARLPFDTLMQRWLFDPLGMSCRYSPAALTPTQREHLATLYRKPDRSAVWVPQFDRASDAGVASGTPAAAQAIGENASVHSPHSGLRISMLDLARLTKLLMQQGLWEGRRILSGDSFEQLLRPHWTLGVESPGDTAGGLFRSWSLGLQRFTNTFDAQGGDRLHDQGDWQAHGHLGSAHGLLSGLMFQPPVGSQPAWGVIYAINGTSQGAAEAPGRHSSLRRSEERVIETLLNVVAATRSKG
jgi:CubicO group peptidase (beta-lactamase class C family)